MTGSAVIRDPSVQASTYLARFVFHGSRLSLRSAGMTRVRRCRCFFMRARSANSLVTQAEAKQLFGALDSLPVLVLAVSGGPDSTALMWLAARWRDELDNPPKLVAVTIDHGLRKESGREARAVARLAKALNIEHVTLRWTGRKPKTGIQEAARNARYRLLSEEAHRRNAIHILTAHTQ